jgi:hypothetical protein
MIEESEYIEIMQAIALIDPTLERWTRRYCNQYSLDYHDRIRAELTTWMSSTLTALKYDQNEFIY